MSETLFSLADPILSALFVAVRQGWPDGEGNSAGCQEATLPVFCGSLFPRLHVLFSPGVLMQLVKMRSQL